MTTHAIGNIDCSCHDCHDTPRSTARLTTLFDAAADAKCHLMVHECDHPQLEQTFRRWAGIRGLEIVEQTLESGRRTLTYTTNIGDGITALLRAPELDLSGLESEGLS